MSQDDYKAVPVEKILTDRPLPADIFVRVNKKFICFRRRGDHITPERLNSFLSHKHASLFVAEAVFTAFMEWIAGEKEQLISAGKAQVGASNVDVVKTHIEVKEKLFTVFVGEKLDEKKVTILQNQTETFVTAMKERKGLMESFASTMSFNKGIAHHSTNVAALGVFLGMSCGHKHPLLLENLYFAGLFHDYGKVKIHPTVLEKPDSTQYKSAVLAHPENSVKYLKSIAEKLSIQDSVMAIVEQHHEWYNGEGYPKGLKGPKIYELARIFSIANAFDNKMANEPNKDARTFAKVIENFSHDKGREFDPKLLERSLEALTFAFSRSKIKEARESILEKTGELNLEEITAEEAQESLESSITNKEFLGE